eukprot:Nk52_evm41s215 gene=Nk52_evmTU41s215
MQWPSTEKDITELIENNVCKFMLSCSHSNLNVKYNEVTYLRDLSTLASNKKITFQNIFGSAFRSYGAFHRFCQIIRTLQMVHSNIKNGIHCTTRSLYYSDPFFFGNQQKVLSLTKTLQCMLQVERSELHITSTPKGLVCGEIEMLIDGTSNVSSIACSTTCGGIPNVEGNRGIRLIFQASKIVVVEKECFFYSLLKSASVKSPLFDPKNTILITGKGYPDLNTKLFLELLILAREVEVYFLVDYNPYGFDIMVQYISHLHRKKIKTKCHFLGLSSSDVENVPPSKRVNLTSKDKAKLDKLLSHPIILNDQHLEHQLKEMLIANVKSELQCVADDKQALQKYLSKKSYLFLNK